MLDQEGGCRFQVRKHVELSEEEARLFDESRFEATWIQMIHAARVSFAGQGRFREIEPTKGG